nr:MAG TPA: hypothetical protein [Caudoviricetes sp.]
MLFNCLTIRIQWYNIHIPTNNNRRKLKWLTPTKNCAR